jgi:hypothetical protein
MFHQGCGGRNVPGVSGVLQFLHDPAVPGRPSGTQVVGSSGREKRKPTPGSVMM